MAGRNERATWGTVTEGGLAAQHRKRVSLPQYVAPTASAAETTFNTLRFPLVPTSCWRLEDTRFEFDSSFIGPLASREFAILAQSRDPKDDEGSLLSVFGHADPVGSDAYNKELSERRAAAVFALLTRDVDIWLRLFQHPQGGDNWGRRAQKRMLQGLGFDPGPIDDETSRAFGRAASQFQSSVGRSPTGHIDDETRRTLFERYMDATCVDWAGIPFRYHRAAFLGGGHAGARGVYQGCSDFNPILVFSKADDDRYEEARAHTERNAANAPNRRVVVYMFPANTKIDNTGWPCPLPAESADACKAQFWSDGDLRRKPDGQERRARTEGKTFACHFYDRLTRFSPCESVRRSITLFLLDETRQRMPVGTPYRIASGQQTFEGILQSPGLLALNDVLDTGYVDVEWGTWDHVPVLHPINVADAVAPLIPAAMQSSSFVASVSPLLPPSTAPPGQLLPVPADADAFLKRKLGDLSQGGEIFFKHPLLPHDLPPIPPEGRAPSPAWPDWPLYRRRVLLDAATALADPGLGVDTPTANKLYNLGYARSVSGLIAFGRDIGARTAEPGVLSDELDHRYDGGFGPLT